MAINQYAAEAKKQLENVNRSSGQTFENQVAYKRDTVFVGPTAALNDLEFFVTGEKDSMYKSKDFPSNTMAYQFTHIVLDAEIVFDANVVKNAKKMKHFLKNSNLEIRNEGKDIAIIPLIELINYNIIPTTDNDLASSPANLFSQYTSRINTAYKLIKPFVVNAGDRPDIVIRVAKGLTTAAYADTYSPFLKNSGLASEQGFYIGVEFQGVQSKLNF